VCCVKCGAKLQCHHSLDSEDVANLVESNCFIVNYWICPNCDNEYEEHFDSDFQRISFSHISDFYQ
jgi:hypothetical protein